MNYIRTEADGQLAFTETTESLMIPSMGFTTPLQRHKPLLPDEMSLYSPVP